MSSITKSDISSVARPLRRRSARIKWRHSGLIFGVCIALISVSTAIFAPYIAPFSPKAQDLLFRLKPPMSVGADGSVFILGTDGLGRDILSRILFAQRVSLLIAAVSVLVSACVGSLVGAIAGFQGGWVDRLVMRIVDIQLSIPFLILALSLVAMMGAGMTSVIIALSAAGWPTYARTIRAEVLRLREQEFVTAAGALGMRGWRVLIRHVAPNTVPTLLVLASLEVGKMILSEAALSYLGFGLPPSSPSLGRMIAEGQQYIYSAGWATSGPGIVLFVLVFGLILIGDGVRDVLDPRLRGSR